jgi:hypothetical protein
MCRPDAFAESQLMFFYPQRLRQSDYISPNAFYPSFFRLPWAAALGANAATGH